MCDDPNSCEVGDVKEWLLSRLEDEVGVEQVR